MEPQPLQPQLNRALAQHADARFRFAEAAHFRRAPRGRLRRSAKRDAIRAAGHAGRLLTRTF